ncbi:hypothetical protein MNBD_UNCLBAC01-1395 [hydrothermal vent metagenome]|uniref:AMP-dependent synthetase/ligase domain-containing protein n=1 Tax=hydrothermal vent metagenome TaxID=652676 RepID=A0A3B1DEP9_9ZZZZ
MDPWKNIKLLSKDDLRRLQNQKLHHFINTYVYPFSPHYQKLFDQNNINPKNICTVEDLAKIPFTSKTDFTHTDEHTGRERFRDFILQPDQDKIRQYWPKTKILSLAVSSFFKGKEYTQEKLRREFQPIFMTFTTGTTTQPISYLYSNHDIKNLEISGSRMLSLFDIHYSDKIVNMFPFAPHLAFWQVVFGGLSSCALIMSTGGGKAIGSEGNISALLKMKPSVILGVPSYVYHVLRLAKEQGCSMDFVEKVVLGAGSVSKNFKFKVAGLLESMGSKNVSVFGTYGFTESRTAWAECPTSNDISSGYHLYPDKEIFEIIDPKTGNVKNEGEDGELVYTSLDARGSVVIRYRTGDFVKGGITTEPCPHCGRTVPRLSSNITRLSNVKGLQLSKIKGSLVNLNNFITTLSDIQNIDEWQVELCKKNNDPYEVDELNLYICSTNGSDQGNLEKEIHQKMLMSTEVAPNRIQFIKMEEIVKRLELETANKEKRIIDNRGEI